MHRAVIFFVMVCGLGSPVAAQPAPGKAASGPCVGVLSHIGDKFTVKKVGYTVFQNEENAAPIDGWRIDDMVASKVTAFFGKRAAVKRLNASNEAFAAYETPKLFGGSDAELAAIVRNAAGSAGCERYVVVTKERVTYGNSNQTLFGLGIVEGGGALPFTRKIELHSYLWLHLYDGQTFAVLRQKVGMLGQSNPLESFFTGLKGPHREVDDSWWPASLDIAQNTKLKDATRALVGQTLDATLPQLLAD